VFFLLSHNEKSSFFEGGKKTKRKMAQKLPKNAKQLRLFLKTLRESNTKLDNLVTKEAFFDFDDDMSTVRDIQWEDWSQNLTVIEKMIVEKMRNNITKKFANLGAFVYIIVQPVKRSSVPWGDYGTTFLVDEYGYDILDIPYIIFELRLNVETKRFQPILGNLCMQHNNLHSKLWSVLQNELGSTVKWDGTEKTAICFKKPAKTTHQQKK
jgi:hypothetical protein